MTNTVYNDNEGSHREPLPIEASVHHSPEVHELLLAAIEMVETARPMPLSTSLMINGEPLLGLLHDAIALLPEELRAARWLLREREEYLEGVRREGEEITAIARSRAERMVERTEVAKSAEQRAERILADAESQARLMRRETEDFCDARLASLEGILDRTRTVVATGRTRLQGTSPIDLTDDVVEPSVTVERAELFDQDFS
jgi:hypothetical protein